MHNRAMPIAPPTVHAVADAVLAGLPEHQQELFGLRLDRWWDDLHDGLSAVYSGADRWRIWNCGWSRQAAAAFRDREPDLHRLDLRRTLDPAWFQDESMLGYAAYAERFAGDLAGISDQIDYLNELGVSYLHLMPLLQPREGDSDGGYAVADYRQVRSDLGTMDDLRQAGHRPARATASAW